jgi:hypothetical protein
MAYSLVTPRIGAQAIAENSTTARHPLGTIVKAHDPTYGEGEFIYLEGVASTTVGAVVRYDVATVDEFQSALATTAVGDSFPLAVAMSACVANEYGWYQISGMAVASKLLAASMVVSSTISVAGGEVDVSVTSNIVQGAMVAVVASANTSASVTTVQLLINRPAMAAIE